MSLFKRASTFFKSEANTALDEAEDPEKMLKQGIRDLKSDLREAMEALAETKSAANKQERDLREAEKRADKYEKDAKKLVQKAEAGEMDAEKADRLARKALDAKRQAESEAEGLRSGHEAQQEQADQLQGQVNKLKEKISQYESELTTLRARSKAASASRKVNEQLAKSDSDGTIAMIERMRGKVEQEEDLAAAYGDMAEENKSVDTEIDEALDESSDPAGTDDDLARLKAELDSEKA
jgi:phage shock protein A